MLCEDITISNEMNGILSRINHKTCSDMKYKL